MLKTELNIFTFGDLLSHYPFRYVDRTKFYKVREINAELPYVQVTGKIREIAIAGGSHNKRLTAELYDETGVIELVWFQGIKWVKPALKENTDYVIFGKPVFYKGKYNIAHPEINLVSSAVPGAGDKTKAAPSLQPVYSTTEKLSAKGLNSKGIQKLQSALFEKIRGSIPENLSGAISRQWHLVGREQALENIHFPENPQWLRSAQLRLKFEELFFIQLELLKIKLLREKNIRGFVFSNIGEHVNRFYNEILPFPLTGAQKRVIKEIRRDLGSGKQMNRLLQGDVGSGKTIVALMAMLIALDNNYQTCLMAPTEILANQHYRNISALVEKIGIKIALLTGSTKAKQRREIHEQLLNGEIKILIGTHALIEEEVQFKNPGLAIIDEQHRFGVEQRAKLYKKSPSPAPHEPAQTSTGGLPPQGKGEKSSAHFSYETARPSSYNLLKVLQEERKKKTTEAEQILWEFLKGKQLEQFKFRRQHIIDEFIVDFVCLSKKLVVEIDGGYHNEPEQKEKDNIRTERLNKLGYKLIRFANTEVVANIDGVLQKIISALKVLPFGEDSGAAPPHILVMTATPIPRTLAMTLYGDLDVSVIDELPPGRKPIKTIHFTDADRLRLFGLMRQEIARGHQVYVVYPLISESEKLDYKHLEEGLEALERSFPRPQYLISAVHGRMKKEGKDAEMQQFIRKETQILVSTTVIEVGVDVPNASVMVIENAERFGLSQLHQLRGRVGRGAEQSYCILMTGEKLGQEGRQRIQTMVQTNDGFKIAEADLQLRGAGDLMGTQQSGEVFLRIANLAMDGQILQAARRTAEELLEDDYELIKPENRPIASQYQIFQKEKKNWSRIS